MTCAFLFPGQGSQAVGMGSYLKNNPIAAEVFSVADEVLGYPLTKMMFEGPEETLKETQNAQPAILSVSVAIGRILREKGISPIVMAGHSLGEYSALVCAQSLEFKDAVKLVHLRGKFMQESVPLGVGTMSAILGAEDQVVEDVCREVSQEGNLVEPANYNCPGQLVISGTVEGVATASERLKEAGAKRCIPLQVSAPFHCSMLKPAAEKLEAELKKVKFHDLGIPYISNVDGELNESSDQILNKLVSQVYKPVLWTQSLQKILHEVKPDEIIEVGPGQVVSGHVKKLDRAFPRKTTDTLEAIEAV